MFIVPKERERKSIVLMLRERLRQIKDIDDRIDMYLGTRISHKYDVLDLIGDKLLRIVPGLIPEALPYLDFHLGCGSWDCPDSPIGKCIYHIGSDLGWDDCILCHQPQERK